MLEYLINKWQTQFDEHLKNRRKYEVNTIEWHKENSCAYRLIDVIDDLTKLKEYKDKEVLDFKELEELC